MKKNILAYLFFALFIAVVVSGCEEDEEPEVKHETGSVTDIDGNIYQTIKIGNQWWMAENLAVTHYRNGNSITQHITGSNDGWANETRGACSNFDDQSLTAPGLLYNWNTIADTGKIAPEGWHVPTDNEWKELERYIGMNGNDADISGWRGTNEADKLRKASPQGWKRFENVWSTNESGFTALAGSCRLFDGRRGEPGLTHDGFWWTATEHPGEAAWYRSLDYKKSAVFRSYTDKNYGFSIRCVKD